MSYVIIALAAIAIILIALVMIDGLRRDREQMTKMDVFRARTEGLR
mgnify:CR=1 FL=1